MWCQSQTAGQLRPTHAAHAAVPPAAGAALVPHNTQMTVSALQALGSVGRRVPAAAAAVARGGAGGSNHTQAPAVTWIVRRGGIRHSVNDGG